MGVDAEPGIANPLWPFERLKRPKLRETDGVSRSGNGASASEDRVLALIAGVIMPSRTVLLHSYTWFSFANLLQYHLDQFGEGCVARSLRFLAHS